MLPLVPPVWRIRAAFARTMPWNCLAATRLLVIITVPITTSYFYHSFPTRTFSYLSLSTSASASPIVVVRFGRRRFVGAFNEKKGLSAATHLLTLIAMWFVLQRYRFVT